MLFIFCKQFGFALVVHVVLLQLDLLLFDLLDEPLLLVDLGLVFGACEADLLLIDVLFEDKSLTSLSLKGKLLFQSLNGLIELLDLIVKAMLLNVLVFSVLVHLLIDLLLHLLGLLSLHSHLLSILSDPDSLIVQALLFLVHS